MAESRRACPCLRRFSGFTIWLRTVQVCWRRRSSPTGKVRCGAYPFRVGPHSASAAWQRLQRRGRRTADGLLTPETATCSWPRAMAAPRGKWRPCRERALRRRGRPTASESVSRCTTSRAACRACGRRPWNVAGRILSLAGTHRATVVAVGRRMEGISFSTGRDKSGRWRSRAGWRGGRIRSRFRSPAAPPGLWKRCRRRTPGTCSRWERRRAAR